MDGCSTYSTYVAPLPENSLATGGCIKHNTYCVTALGWLKKKKRNEMNNSDFQPLQVYIYMYHFKIVTTRIAITTADWGRLYKLLYVVLIRH